MPSFSSYIPWPEDFEHSMAHRWLQKPVLASRPIPFNRSIDDWRVEGIATIALQGNNPFDKRERLHFRTSLKDEAFIRQERNDLGSFNGESGGGTSAILRFDPPQDWSDFNRIAAWIYVHPTRMKRLALNLQLEPEFRPPLPPYDFISYPRPTFHAQHLTQGQWNLVLWEISDYPRQAITGFILSQELFGYEPGTEGVVAYDLGKLELQHVEAEKFEGWEIAPGRIAFSHLGYLPGQRKVALASGLNSVLFQVRDGYTGEVILSRPIQERITPQGKFQELDFSDLAEGYYRLQAGEILTQPFPVDEDLWRMTILKLLNFYSCERCNFPVAGLHDACHQDVFGVHGELKKPINGGWHDAADFSQGCHQTGLSIYAMLSLYDQLHRRQQEPILQQHILDEARWGLDWLLKTRFRDGYRIAFQVARIYTDNIPGTLDDILTPAKNIPFLNLLCAAVEALAYECLHPSFPDQAQECLRCAVEDWEFGMAGDPDDYLTASWGVIASVHLHRITSEDRYKEKAQTCGQIVLDCQERSFDGIPLAGYFYRDVAHSALVHHNHLGFEESPLLALFSLCQAFPDHPRWIDWYAAAAIHADYLQKRGAEATAPFFMLANGIYRLSEFADPPDRKSAQPFGVETIQHEQDDSARRTRQEKLRQVQAGIPLGGETYLKRFPVWENELFRGGTAVQLSQALALTLAASLRSDLPGEKLALRQLQWVLGFNPFCQSLMYGEGYDYLSLHAHRQMDMVGALPVGMDCRAGDQPYWSPSNYATQKEIWVVPASRFLWNLAYLAMPALVRGSVTRAQESARPTKSVSFQDLTTGKTRRAQLDAAGMFSCNLPSGTYEVRCGALRRTLTLTQGNQYDLELDVRHFIDFEIEVVKQTPQNVQLRLSAMGRGRHTFEIRLFNARLLSSLPEIVLEERLPAQALIELAIEDPQTPWLALFIPDGQKVWAKEILSHSPSISIQWTGR